MRLGYYIILLQLVQKYISYVKIYLSRQNEIIIGLRTYIYLLPLLYFFNLCSLSQSKTLTDICVIDFPQNYFRFRVQYILLSVIYNLRVSVICFLTEANSLLSVYELYRSAV